MAAEVKVTINCDITGLGNEIQIKDVFTGTTPTLATKIYKVQAVSDTAEALDLGGVSTIEGICLKAVDNDMVVDASYSASFVSDLYIAEGETAYFKPSGVPYIKNETAKEVCTYEYIVYGT